MSLPCGLARSSEQDKKNLCKAVKENLALPSSGQALFRSLDEIDWVYCGQDFSDQPYD